MPLNEFLSFALAVIVLVATPGPATVLLAATSANYGRAAGFSLMASLISSMLCVILLTSTGLLTLILAWPPVSRIATALAAAYMLWLAGRIATAPVFSHAQDTGGPPPFRTGFVLNLINPKAYAAIAAPFSSFVLVPEQPLVDVSLKAAISLAVLVSTQTVWILTGSVFGRYLRHPRIGRVVNVAFALLLLASLTLTYLR